MRKVTLLFPDHLTIADFVPSEKIRDAEVDGADQTLTALLSQRDIELAFERYGAIVHPSQDYV